MSSGQVPDPPRPPSGAPVPEVLRSGREPGPRPWGSLLTRVGDRLRRRLLHLVPAWPARLRRRSAHQARAHRPSALALALLALAVGVLALHWVGAPLPPAVPRPSPSASAGHGEASTLAQVVFQATEPGPLRDYVRPDTAGGACPQASVGYSATGSVAAALARGLPGFVVMDLSRTYNQTPGLCALLVRARDPSGTIALVQVIAPDRPGLQAQVVWLSDAARADGSTATKYVSATTTSGWTVRIGTTGPIPTQPSTQQLFAVAQDPRLTW